MAGEFPGNQRFLSDLAEPRPDAFYAGTAARNEERLPDQLLQRENIPALPRDRMVDRHKRGPWLVCDGKAVEQFCVVRCGDQRQIRKPVVKTVQHIVSAAVPETEGNLGKLHPESGDPAGQQIGRTAFHQTDIQLAGETFKGTDLFLRLLGELQELLGPAVEYGSGIGQGQVSLAANKKLCPKLLFQSFHLVGKGRLTHIKLFRGTGDIQFLCHSDKVSESTQIQLKNLLIRCSIKGVYPENQRKSRKSYEDSITLRWRRSWKAHGRTGHPPGSLPNRGWASRSRRSWAPGRDRTFQKCPGRADFLW